jgi:hypothetical protein
MTWLVAVLLSIPPIILGIAIFGEEHELKMLANRGADISGTIVRLQPPVTDRGRNNHGPLVDYNYEPAELAGKPDYIIRDERGVASSEYEVLRTGRSISLVYDPKRPDQSQLKGRVEAYRLGKDWGAPPRSLLLVAVIPFGLVCLMLWQYLRERRLLRWGRVTKATIIGEVEYENHGKWSRVLYSFENESGETVRGKKGGLARSDDPRPNFIQHRERCLANPIVFYNTRNSAQNMLYPGSAAKLAQ